MDGAWTAARNNANNYQLATEGSRKAAGAGASSKARGKKKKAKDDDDIEEEEATAPSSRADVIYGMVRA